MKVIKFGGSSLADASLIKNVCDIVVSDAERGIVVVSAPGISPSFNRKVTDMLIDAANATLKEGRASGEEALLPIIDRFRKIAEGLDVEGEVEAIEKDLVSRLDADTSSDKRFIDLMKAAGEDNNAKLVAAYLNKIGHKATYVNPGEAGMILSNEYGNAKILNKSFDLLKANLSKIDGIVVFPGFFGRTEAGEIATFPRGGSDITGAILAAAIEADVYENFTDVDYVYSVNPKIINNPKPISIVTYREMRELSYAGFNVYQEEALLPVFRAGIPVNIRNANNPTCPGTMIVSERNTFSQSVRVAGVACDGGFTSIYISKYLMNREVGFGRKVLSILEDEGISYEHSPTGIDDMTLIIKSSLLDNGILERITDRIKNELGADDVVVSNGLSLIVVVGEGMKQAIGIAAKATAALSGADINIKMISQGSSEVSMIFAVDNELSIRGVCALYEALLCD